MPYVALPHADQATRRALAGARWRQVSDAKPELAAAVALQGALIGLVNDLADQFDRSGAPKLTLPPRYLTTKLAAGIPALSGEPIRLPVDMLQPTFVGLCRALAAGGGGEATAKILEVVESGRFDTRAALMLALRREQGAIRMAATRAGLGHELLWLLADLCVAPFAHAVLDAVFTTAPEPLLSALHTWSRGYCPLCGSWPTLVERIDGARRLRCSLCAAAWEQPDGGCLFCGEQGESFSVVAPSPAAPMRTLDLCRTCKGYSKAVPTDQSLPFPLVALADLDSMDLDMAAMQAGFARPALKAFGVRR